MKRIVQVKGQNGVAYAVPMTAEEVAFFLKLADIKAKTQPKVTFDELVIQAVEKKETQNNLN